MSVPHTSTHVLSLRHHNQLGTRDSIHDQPVAELRHPVQRITYRDGSGDPQNYGYNGFYELDELSRPSSHQKYKFNLNDYDDVEWGELKVNDPFANTTGSTSGVLHSNYSYDTQKKLQEAREIQERPNVRNGHLQLIQQRIRQARAALHRRQASTTAWHDDGLLESMQNMSLGKRGTNENTSEGISKKRLFDTSLSLRSSPWHM